MGSLVKTVMFLNCLPFLPRVLKATSRLTESPGSINSLSKIASVQLQFVLIFRMLKIQNLFYRDENSTKFNRDRNQTETGDYRSTHHWNQSGTNWQNINMSSCTSTDTQQQKVVLLFMRSSAVKRHHCALVHIK